MTINAANAPHVSLQDAAAAAVRQVGSLTRTGWVGVTHPAALGIWRIVMLTGWLLGTAGDAFTTLTMMGTGQFEEANGVAAAGMGVLGPAGYTAAASGICVLLAVLGSGRATGKYARALQLGIWLAGALKVYTVLSNVTVWSGS